MIPWATSIRYGTFRTLGWALIWIVFVPLTVQHVHDNPEAWRRFTSDFFETPLLPILLIAVVFFLVRAYCDLMAWETALGESRLQERGLSRFGIAADNHLMVARLPGRVWSGRRCLMISRLRLQGVDCHVVGTNPQEPQERFLCFRCINPDDTAVRFLLPYALDMDFDSAARQLDRWAKGDGMPTTKAGTGLAKDQPVPSHRFALVWVGLLVALSLLTWYYPA